MSTLLLCSGGMDSVTLAHELAAQESRLTLLGVDYGQRHARELTSAASCADRLGAGFVTVDLRGVGRLLTGSALTDPTVPVPEGHYAEKSMRQTVVYFRNPIMLSIAMSIARARGDATVAAAMHAGDHFIYPDCRPAFVEAFEAMTNAALDTFDPPGLVTPYLHLTKADIVARGAKLGVPYELTWSCYVGDERHCGRCGTCVERREAFELAGIEDPTDYEHQEEHA